MQLTHKGYNIRFIQTHPKCSAHEYRYVYKFFSSVTKLHYIIYCDLHAYDFIAVKFYAKIHKASPRKYSIVVNRGDVANILITCAKAIPELLIKHPNASFGFIGARTIDVESEKVEGYKKNQRFRLYTYHIPQLIGDKTFMHKSYPNASSYVLINRNNSDLKKLEKSIKSMVCSTYPDLLNIQF
ncbi:hypothetical protein [Psychroserpens algicola]|uniref:hypothetical protein n=1 Tax=Psychroserpens algicola TaxID=1719034 RepID=UPI0019536FCF|nr:hypothetical protein [Psychroserpens algicola]